MFFIVLEYKSFQLDTEHIPKAQLQPSFFIGSAPGKSLSGISGKVFPLCWFELAGYAELQTLGSLFGVRPPFRLPTAIRIAGLCKVCVVICHSDRQVKIHTSKKGRQQRVRVSKDKPQFC